MKNKQSIIEHRNKVLGDIKESSSKDNIISFSKSKRKSMAIDRSGKILIIK